MSEQTEELHRAARCVYIATDKPVADDLARILTSAADRIALLEKACEASATYIRHDSLRPSAAHKNAFFRLCDAGYLGEGGDE